MSESKAVHSAFAAVESDLWDAFYAVEVLVDRITAHFEDAAPNGHHISEHDGTATFWMAGEVRRKLDVLTKHFGDAQSGNLAAFAKMDELSEAVDAAAEADDYDPSTNPVLKAWEAPAIEAATTVPTTKAGLVTLLERLAADIKRGPSCWQQQAALTAGVAVGTLMQGGEHV